MKPERTTCHLRTELQHMSHAHIETILAHLGLSVAAAQQQRLAQYARIVIDANARVNITGARDIAGFILGPLFDALTLIPVLRAHATLIDVGSGGGLPALPLAILRPEITLTLTEPRPRRFRFLQEAATALDLPLDIRATQDRELPAQSWDGAVAQAVFPPPIWLKRGRRLVRDGGDLYALTSSPIDPPALPPKCRIEQQQSWQRPGDATPRYATRVGVYAHAAPLKDVAENNGD